MVDIAYGNNTALVTSTIESLLIIIVTASTLACFLAYYLLVRRVKFILVLSSVAGCMVAYSLLTAFMSPYPPLANSTVGPVIIVSTNVFTIIL